MTMSCHTGAIALDMLGSLAAMSPGYNPSMRVHDFV